MTVKASRTGALLGTLIDGADFTPAIKTAAVVFVAVLTAAAAQIGVPLPFTPVPLTFVPMVVLLGAATLGSRLGMASQVLYLAAGIAGLPVFVASATLPQGPMRLLGPTGGYLMSYPIAALVTGWLCERGFDRRYLTSVVAMGAGLAVIFAFGVSWLAWLAHPAHSGLESALAVGLYPFIAADVLKICVAAAIMPAVWKLLPPSPRRR